MSPFACSPFACSHPPVLTTPPVRLSSAFPSATGCRDCSMPYTDLRGVVWCVDFITRFLLAESANSEPFHIRKNTALGLDFKPTPTRDERVCLSSKPLFCSVYSLH